jgi:hypothetical protein
MGIHNTHSAKAQIGAPNPKRKTNKIPKLAGIRAR